MSGGSWDYVYGKMQEAADRLIDEKETPLRISFGEHLARCADALHDIEWVDSGDIGPGGENDAILEVFKKLSPADSARFTAIKKLDKLAAQLKDLADALSEENREPTKSELIEKLSPNVPLIKLAPVVTDPVDFKGLGTFAKNDDADKAGVDDDTSKGVGFFNLNHTPEEVVDWAFEELGKYGDFSVWDEFIEGRNRMLAYLRKQAAK